MAEPRFSIVIPTRERARTLFYSLKTCLEQDFSDYEIVVGDNHSSPATHEVVAQFASPRIRYVRAPQALSMTANWELAVSQARGEYVIVIGDDDALLFHALRELDKLITQTQAKAIRWQAAYYSWPDFALAGQENYLRIPTSRSFATVDARKVIPRVLSFQACYTSLPMLYNAAVHRDLIGLLRARTGCVFANCYPDVYTGFAVAWVAQKFLSLETPMTIAGASGKSYGIAACFLRDKSPLDREFRESNRREGVRTHRWIPDLALFPFGPVADSFLIAKELLFPNEDSLQLDRRKLAAHYVAAIRVEDEVAWKQALERIHDTFADDPESQAWFASTLGRTPFRKAEPFQIRPSQLGMGQDALNLGADRFGVTDVFAAAQVCENVLNYRQNGIQFTQDFAPDEDLLSNALGRDTSVSSAFPSSEQVAQLQSIAQERLATIRRLSTEVRTLACAAEERLAAINVLDAEVQRLKGSTFSRRVYDLCRRMARFVPTRVRNLVRRSGTVRQN